jgi:protein arginine N-methyltransferase 1
MFGRMFADPVRHGAYMAAMREVIEPGHVVLDIGTGVGVYALAAAAMGARQVYAIEVNPYVRLGTELAKVNGFGDRVTFIEGMSTEVELPERADVIVADLRGLLPFHGQHLPSMLDARNRHLAPGGVMMPTGDRVFAALAESPEADRLYRRMWLENPFRLDLSGVVDRTANELRRDAVSAEELLTDPVEVASIDYHHGLSDPGFVFRGTLPTTRSGRATGIALWFEATVIEGITYSTGPFSRPTIYGRAFLPFRSPADLESGAEVDVAVSAWLVDDYIYEWSGESTDVSGAPWSSHQTTFDAVPLTAESVLRRRAGHVPPATRAMRIDAVVLESFNAGASLGDCADLLLAEFPDDFESRSRALTHVADLAERYV